MPTSYGVPLFILVTAVAITICHKCDRFTEKIKHWFQKRTAQPECQWRDYWIVCTLGAKLANRWVLDLLKRTALLSPMRNSWMLCCVVYLSEVSWTIKWFSHFCNSLTPHRKTVKQTQVSCDFIYCGFKTSHMWLQYGLVLTDHSLHCIAHIIAHQGFGETPNPMYFAVWFILYAICVTNDTSDCVRKVRYYCSKQMNKAIEWFLPRGQWNWWDNLTGFYWSRDWR